MALGTILTGLQILSSVSSYSAAQEGAQQLLEAGEANAQLAELEGEESVRRYEIEQKRLQGKMVVNYAKSGVVLQGTPLDVLAEAVNEADREVAFMRKQTAATAEARRKGASTQAAQLSSEGTSLLIGGLGQAASTAYDYGLINPTTSSLKIT